MRKTTLITVLVTTTTTMVVVGAAGISDIASGDGSLALVRATRARLDTAILAALEHRDDGSSRAAALRAFYEGREGDPLWVGRKRLNRHGRQLTDLLCDAASHGLDPGRYRDGVDALLEEAYRGRPDSDAIGALELLLTERFLDHAGDLAAGAGVPADDSGWHLGPADRPDDAALLAQVVDRGAAEVLRATPPQDDAYHALREAYARQTRIVAEGGWPEIPGGAALEVGMEDPRVRTARERLAVSGDHRGDLESPLFDEALAQAVRRFQERHGLEADGVIGPGTLKALNVTASDRLRQIAVALERRRWEPRFGHDRDGIVVNVPEFMMRTYRDGREIISMKVIVGTSDNATPLFEDRLTHLVFRPYWNVPLSIALEELLPKFHEDPGSFTRSNYEVVDADNRVVPLHRSGTGAGEPVELASVVWDNHLLSRLLPGTGVRLDERALERQELRIRQRPGPNNALGLVKFMFPNPHDVYLHDTPTDPLFERAQRAFSHGCVRLEKPGLLAEALLEPEGWSWQRVQEAMHDGEDDRTVELSESIPVMLTYRTAWVGDDGRLNFRDDIYGLDAGVNVALADPAATCGPAPDRRIG